jgi:hypothetical protein
MTSEGRCLCGAVLDAEALFLAIVRGYMVREHPPNPSGQQ